MNVARKFILPLFLLAGLVVPIVPLARADSITNQTNSVADEARQRRAKSPIAKGTLQDIDLYRHELKLKTQDGVRSFLYTTRTYVFRGKEKITADKLKVGETIAVRF